MGSNRQGKERTAEARPGAGSGTRSRKELQRLAHPRDAALRFLEGGRQGWRPEDFARWCVDELLDWGLLTIHDPASERFVVREAGGPELSLPLQPAGFVDAAASALCELARSRVIAALQRLFDDPPNDAFVLSALYEGRVERLREPAPHWSPSLREGQPLSQWVLGLFAADALARRVDYETRLVVCVECGAVGFGWHTSSRRLCLRHDEGGGLALLDPDRERRSTLPEVPPPKPTR